MLHDHLRNLNFYLQCFCFVNEVLLNRRTPARAWSSASGCLTTPTLWGVFRCPLTPLHPSPSPHLAPLPNPALSPSVPNQESEQRCGQGRHACRCPTADQAHGGAWPACPHLGAGSATEHSVVNSGLATEQVVKWPSCSPLSLVLSASWRELQSLGVMWPGWIGQRTRGKVEKLQRLPCPLGTVQVWGLAEGEPGSWWATCLCWVAPCGSYLRGSTLTLRVLLRPRETILNSKFFKLPCQRETIEDRKICASFNARFSTVLFFLLFEQEACVLLLQWDVKIM